MRRIVRSLSFSLYFYAILSTTRKYYFEVRKNILICWIDLSLKPIDWKIINSLATYNFQDLDYDSLNQPGDESVSKTWSNTHEQTVWDKVQMDKPGNISLAFPSWPVCLETNLRMWRWRHCRCSFKVEHKFVMLWLIKLEGRQDFKSLTYSLCQCSPSLSSNKSIYISSFCSLGSDSC